MKLVDFINNKKEENLMSEAVVEKRNGRFFPISTKGKPIGLKAGYATAKEAVRAFYDESLTTFKYLNPERQETLVNNYLNKRVDLR